MILMKKDFKFKNINNLNNDKPFYFRENKEKHEESFCLSISNDK